MIHLALGDGFEKVFDVDLDQPPRRAVLAGVLDWGTVGLVCGGADVRLGFEQDVVVEPPLDRHQMWLCDSDLPIAASPLLNVEESVMG